MNKFELLDNIIVYGFQPKINVLKVKLDNQGNKAVLFDY